MTEQFRVLRLLGRLYKIVAFLGLVVGVLAFVSELFRTDIRTSKDIDGVRLATIALASAVHFVVFYGLSEAVEVLLSIREAVNRIAATTRKIAGGPAKQERESEPPLEDRVVVEDEPPARCERCDMRVVIGQKLCAACRRAVRKE